MGALLELEEAQAEADMTNYDLYHVRREKWKAVGGEEQTGEWGGSYTLWVMVHALSRCLHVLHPVLIPLPLTEQVQLAVKEDPKSEELTAIIRVPGASENRPHLAYGDEVRDLSHEP